MLQLLKLRLIWNHVLRFGFNNIRGKHQKSGSTRKSTAILYQPLMCSSKHGWHQLSVVNAEQYANVTVQLANQTFFGKA